MQSTNWKSKIKNELRNAEKAREQGNLGRMRVCARRAAGWGIIEYYRQQGMTDVPASALACIRFMREQKKTPSNVIQALDRLNLKVEKDTLTEINYLPGDIDLISEATWLLTYLFGDGWESGNS